MMDDHGLLRDLARTAREEEAEEQQRWDRWDRLNDGALSPEEEAELRAQAATSVEAEKAFEAFRPLDTDFRVRVVAAIGPLVKGDTAPAEVRAPVKAPVWEERRRKVRKETSHGRLTFPWWRAGFAWRAGFVGSGLAAAAAALFFMLRLPALPEFLVEVEPVLTIRGEGETFTPGGQFKAAIWPATKLSKKAQIESRCYVEPMKPAKSKFRPATCTPSKPHDENGSLEIQGSLPNDLPLGTATLWIVLSYSGHQPDVDAIGKLDTGRRTRRRDWDAEPKLIEIRAP